MTTLRAEPVPVVSRIAALDVIRGIALFGILVVNVAFFATPLGESLAPGHLAEESAPNQLAWAIEMVFFQGKFISLFSILFGAGLALQMARADAVASAARAAGIRARSTACLILRRLGILALVGLAHAWFVWYGDILFFYGVLGGLLIPVRLLTARTALILAIVLASLSVTCVVGFGALKALGSAIEQQQKEVIESAERKAAGAQQTTTATTEADAFVEPVEQDPGSVAPDEMNTDEDASLDDAAVANPDNRETLPFRALDTMVNSPGALFSDEWLAMERELYCDGPWIEVTALRVLSWAFILPVMIFIYSPHVVAMFLLGMTASKRGWLRREAATVQRRAAMIGLTAGIAINLVAAYLMWDSGFDHGSMASAVAAMLLELGAYVLAVGYAGLFARLAYAGSFAPLTRMIANAGRMAFTVYLAESVLMTGLMYHWGFALFGTFERWQLAVIAVVTWLVLVVFANLWLSAFRMGPLEWLWRMGTYLEVPRLRRRGDETAEDSASA